MQQTGHFGMRPFSAMPTAGLVGIPGQQNIGVTAPLQHAFTDMDPITPGIQTSPGIVTPTGPPIVIQYGTGVFNNNLQSTGAMIGGSIDSTAGATTFGIVNGPPGLAKNQQITVINTSITDRINPVIQNYNSVTPVGFQSSVNPQSVFNNQDFVQQTAIIPAQFQGGSRMRKNCLNCCPYWVWVLLALTILVAIIVGLFAFLKPNSGINNEEFQQNTVYQNNSNQQCQGGQIRFNGKCIRCPEGTIWSGKNCIMNNNYRPDTQQPNPNTLLSTQLNPSVDRSIDNSIDRPADRLNNQNYQSVINNPNLNDGNFKRIESVKTSWNSGNGTGNYADGFSAGSSTRFSKSIGEIKKVIVEPLIEDPLR